MIPLRLSTPEQWLGYVSAPLAPSEVEKALAADHAHIAQWREEGLSDAEIVARLGDPGLAARSLSANYLTRAEEARLRPQLGWNPWRLALAVLAMLAISMLFEYGEHRSLSVWNLLIAAYGAVQMAALLWLRRHVSPWVWASLGSGLFPLVIPLVLLSSTIRGRDLGPTSAAIFFAVLLLVAGLSYTFAPTRQKLERQERLREEQAEVRVEQTP
ncbi:hypothetical protein HLB42_20340 (plasmid) [Deinococcus sp. D7000]|nr:hypothetical protein HLB42_20340 [Deinococcus sp. D7000]